jgi:hypothetical protein
MMELRIDSGEITVLRNIRESQPDTKGDRNISELSYFRFDIVGIFVGSRFESE